MNDPDQESFSRLFEEQARRTPDATAVVSGEQRLTYRELNEQANQLGHYLRSLGVGPEVFVGVCMERCALTLVGLLGILKAGGAYVPLDPQYPRERLLFMLEDTRLDILLTLSHLKEALSGRVARAICLDTEWEVVSRERTDGVSSMTSGANAAYLVYTSGSTGKPKGAVIQHRSTLGLMHWAMEEFGADTLAGVLAASSICFDMSVFELFAPLCSGGTVILAENVLQLSNLPAANEVTLISTVPSAISELVELGWVPEATRAVLLAGEALPQKVVRQIFADTNIERVWNLYGLSEDTSYTTSALITRGRNAPVTIGRPNARREVYVLDARLRPAPTGTTGELFVSGEGLARGYLNRPGLTAERFIPNPFGGAPGARMYRTGDVVRRQPDGDMEFLGRIDHQLKIRGYRIEAGEIEAVLGAHPGVSTSAVVQQEDADGESRLVAYVVADKQRRPSINELRDQLKSKVPKWMTPSAIILIDRMPLTANGKIDRRRLAGPEMSESRLPLTGVV